MSDSIGRESPDCCNSKQLIRQSPEEQTISLWAQREKNTLNSIKAPRQKYLTVRIPGTPREKKNILTPEEKHCPQEVTQTEVY